MAVTLVPPRRKQDPKLPELKFRPTIICMAAHLEMRSSAVEDYTKAIYALEQRTPEPVSTNALAERLGVTPASASGMVKRLGSWDSSPTCATAACR